MEEFCYSNEINLLELQMLKLTFLICALFILKLSATAQVDKREYDPQHTHERIRDAKHPELKIR